MTRKKVVTILMCLTLVVFAGVLYKYRARVFDIIVPFFLALIICYLFMPLINWLESHGIRKSIALLSIYLSIIVLAVVAFIYIYPEMVRSLEELSAIAPEVSSSYQQIFDNIISSIRYSKWSDDIKNMIFSEINNSIVTIEGYISSLLKKAIDGLIDTVSLIINGVLAMVIAFYFITDSSFFITIFKSITPKKWRNGMRETIRQIDDVLSKFIQGQLLIAVIIGLIETVGLYIIGVRFALLLGIIGAIGNIIPYFGPVIGAIPAVILSFIQSPTKAFWVIILVIIAQQIENIIIEPRVIEGKLGFHPVTTIFLVMAGGEFFGIMGMLFAIPVAAVIKVLVKQAMSAI